MKSCILYLSVALLLISCNKSSGTNEPDPIINPPVSSNFVKGVDVSWLTQMEQQGRKFYKALGTEVECMQLLKDLGVNTIRLRVWVDPAGGWNNTADVVAKAIRAKNLGMKIMIDFHYSDSWADPGQQTKPSAWINQDFAALKQSLASHTISVLTALKSAGVTPAWVQVGNETNDGMLWPDGKASVNMNNFAQLVLAGYNAVKGIDTSIKVIVHISNGYDNSLFRWIFDGLKNNGAQWDIIGMSLYPSSTDWTQKNNQCLSNINDMIARYNKDVMVVEVGMPWDQSATCKSFLADLITKVSSVPQNRGLGVLYWEPQAYANWEGYTLGAFDNSGKPTSAMDAFK